MHKDKYVFAQLTAFLDRNKFNYIVRKLVHPTFRVIVSKTEKTAEQIVYLNNHKQMYNNEQQFSISRLGSI